MGGKKSGFIVPVALAAVVTSYFVLKAKKKREKERKKLLKGMYNDMLLRKGFSEDFVVKLETFRLKCENFKFVRESAVVCYDKGATTNQIRFEIKVCLGGLVTDCCLLLKQANPSEQKEVLKVYVIFLTAALKKFFVCLHEKNPKNIDEIIFSWKHIAKTEVPFNCYNSLGDEQQKAVSGIFAKALRNELLNNQWIVKDSYDVVKLVDQVPSEEWIKSFCLDFPDAIIGSKKFYNLLLQEIKKAGELSKYFELKYPKSIMNLVDKISKDLQSQPEKIVG